MAHPEPWLRTRGRGMGCAGVQCREHRVAARRRAWKTLEAKEKKESKPEKKESKPAVRARGRAVESRCGAARRERERACCRGGGGLAARACVLRARAYV